MKKLTLLVVLTLILGLQQSSAQRSIKEQKMHNESFFSFQLQFDKVSRAYSRYYNTLKKDFAKAGLSFPVEKIFIRTFKHEREVEVWVQLEESDTFLNYKTFRMCGSSGELGPKRREGDLQIPEGAYFIDEFNPKSNYFLSLLLNYPNYSDLIHTTSPSSPGGDIYVHGSCVSVGCIPISDDGIMELYLLSMMARANGQTHIPVHIFPVRYDKQGMRQLGKIYEKERSKIPYWLNIKKLYDYFQTYHTVPIVMYDKNGEYVVDI